MGHYMVTGSYTSEAWAAQVKNPQNRLEAIAQHQQKKRLHVCG